MSDSKTPAKRRVGDGTPGPGRPKGMPNKTTVELRDMVMTALDGAGGAEYLCMQAFDNPAAFLALVGKCLPKDVNLTAKGNLADLLRAARERVGKPRG
ncbi:MAG TPA: hypothetical protein VF457_15670 [Burkholderiaceae bacterium]